jgi:hypothetical protein
MAVRAACNRGVKDRPLVDHVLNSTFRIPHSEFPFLPSYRLRKNATRSARSCFGNSPSIWCLNREKTSSRVPARLSWIGRNPIELDLLRTGLPTRNQRLEAAAKTAPRRGTTRGGDYFFLPSMRQ